MIATFVVKIVVMTIARDSTEQLVAIKVVAMSEYYYKIYCYMILRLGAYSDKFCGNIHHYMGVRYPPVAGYF